MTRKKSKKSSPKQKEKKRLELISNVRKQDKIVTTGGMHGVVTSVKENEVIVRVDDAKDVIVQKLIFINSR